MFADGTTEVVYGNYDTYELLRQSRAQADKASVVPSGRRGSPPTSGLRPDARPEKDKRKRKFPYRKVPDIEADIAATEKRVADLEVAMQTPEVYKDATRVRDTMNDLEKTKNALALLYQHWEEAVELNG